MSQTVIDKNALLAPIAEGEPSGEYLFYTAVYDEIRQARKTCDPAYAAEGEAKEAEWGKVVALCSTALAQRSKDLLLASWLTEGLVIREGFSGLSVGLSVLDGLVDRYWESVYPLIEDDDYDGRAAPFQFLNDKISICVKQIPLTDPKTTAGYGLLRYRESRKVGYESEGKGDLREEALADGKISAELFDHAVNKTAASFYLVLLEAIAGSVEQFQKLEAAVDEKFGIHAPGMSELGEALDECRRLVLKICEQKGLKAGLKNGGLSAEAAPEASAAQTGQTGQTGQAAPPPHADAQEALIWDHALEVMQGGSFKKALDLLLGTATSQPSERGRCRYRFLVAKLCLKAGHPELARPILEQLNSMVTELQLEKWESPFWISEILEALYQCLNACEDAEEEAARAKEIFRKICTLDVTKALG